MNRFISYKNININFSIEGKGSTIVLLHGFLEDSSMWNNITKEISKKNKVITIDLLGHGKSECLGYIHSMEEMAEIVISVLKSESIRKATFIGHSMGGYVVLALAEKYTKAIKGLCLINSTSQADTEERKQLRLRAIKMAQTNYEALVKMSVTNLFVQEIRNNILEEIERTKQIALKTNVQSYIACTEGMRIRQNRESVLKTAEFKKLIIIGKKDPVLKYESILEEAERTKTPLVSLSNGHMSHIENKEELLNALLLFLKKK